LLGFAQIRAKRDDVGAGHQRGGMGGDQWINVDVDDARLGRHPVRDLVRIGHARQPRAKVEELADALAEHVVDHPLQQVTAFNRGVGRERYAYLQGHRLDRLDRLAVDREIIFSPQVVVPNAAVFGYLRPLESLGSGSGAAGGTAVIGHLLPRAGKGTTDTNGKSASAIGR
jgi:hypothetical protein